MATIELRNKVGEMTYDGLIIDVSPAPRVEGGELYKASGSEMTVKRGTVLGLVAGGAAAGKLVPLGTTQGDSTSITANCILCDDVVVGTSGNEKVAVYTAGCFNSNKLITVEEHAIDAADIDALRIRGIVIKAASK